MADLACHDPSRVEEEQVIEEKVSNKGEREGKTVEGERGEKAVDEGESEEQPVDSKKSLKSFTLFRQLPLELRLKIWKEACPGPRVIVVRYRFKVMPHTLRADEVDFWGAEENTPRIVEWVRPSVEIPLVLHVCRESREEALTIFEAGLEVRPGGHQTYWKPMLDTVFLIKPSGRRVGSTLRSLDELPLHARVRIRHLATDLNDSTMSFTDEEIGDELRPLVGFTNLQSLTLVVDPLPPYIFQSRVIFREPLDVPIMQLQAAQPTAIERRFISILEHIGACNLGWQPPTVRVMVALWGMRKNAWCIKPQKTTPVDSSTTVLRPNAIYGC